MNDFGSERAKENLRAFARLAAIIKWFYPSDQASKLDLADFLSANAAVVARAANREELARKLVETVQLLAPDVTLSAGSSQKMSRLTQPPQDDLSRVFWSRLGFGDSGTRPFVARRQYQPDTKAATRVGILSQRRSIPGGVSRVHIHLDGRTTQRDSAASSACAFLAAYDRQGRVFALDTVSFPESGWKRLALGVQVTPLASSVCFGAYVVGASCAEVRRPAVAFDDGRPEEAGSAFDLSEAPVEAVRPTFAPGRLETVPSLYALDVSSDEELHVPIYQFGAWGLEPSVRNWTGEIGGGLTADVPLVVPGDEFGTLPRASTSQAKREVAEPSAMNVGFVLAVATTLELFSTKPAPSGWRDAVDRAIEAANEAPDQGTVVLEANRMIAQYRDGHAMVFCARAERCTRADLEVERVDEGVVVVGSGSQEIVGQRLLSIDSQPVTADNALDQSAANESLRLRRYVESLLTSETQRTFEVAVRNVDGRVSTHRVPTAKLPAPEKWSVLNAVDDAGSDIVYIDATRLDEEAMLALPPELTNVAGLIIDVRGYPNAEFWRFLGHFSNARLWSPRFLTPMVSGPDRATWRNYSSQWLVEPRLPRLTSNVAFLIDERAISYAETCLEIVRANGLGVLVGSDTAGTNGNVTFARITDSLSLSWTGMATTTALGDEFVRVSPDIRVTLRWADVVQSRDTLIDVAVGRLVAQAERAVARSALRGGYDL